MRFASGHGVQAVENVSLTVDKKEKVCIVGETGSGKSILLLAILHLLPEKCHCDQGRLFRRGRPDPDETPSAGQDPRSQNFPMCPREAETA
ncbi:MAG: ATP-binding cassette domain-containing protein [Blautia sp.]